MRLYLGPFIWAERVSSKTGLPSPAGVYGWRMPPGAVQAIDFRGPQGSESAGALSPAQAVFITPDEVVLPAPWVQIASDPAETLTAANRTLLRNAFQHGKAVVARRFAPVLHELMTTHAELDRARCAPPRIASRDGKIKWLIGGQVVHAVEPGIASPEWAGVVARHRDVYRAIRLAAGGTRLHSKYLTTLLRKYRLSEAQAVDAFIPADLPREAPVEPSTTYTETFPGTSGTLGGDQTWTEFSGTWDNASGIGRCGADANTRNARCESVLSTDDMSVQVSVLSSTAGNAYRGPVGRQSASAFTCYSNISRPEVNDYYGQRITAGSSTDIITSELSGSITLPSTSKVVIDGDQIEIFEGANSRGSTTDTNITGHVRGGLAAYGEGGGQTIRFDTWQAEDLVGGIDGVVANAASATTTTTPAGTQTHAGVVAAASSATALSAPTATQTHEGAVAAASSATAASAPAGSIAYAGAVAAAASATAASAPAATQDHAGVLANAASATATSAPTATQTHEGTVASASSATAASTPSGGSPGVDNIVSATSTSTPAGTQTHAGGVAAASSTTALSTPSGSAGTSGTVADAASATSVTAPAGTQTHAGVVAAAASASVATAPAGTQTHQGAIAAAVSATQASTPAGVQGGAGLTLLGHAAPALSRTTCSRPRLARRPSPALSRTALSSVHALP